MTSESNGVAEGLREAMLDYIATAKEDYLANPRFWGAFIIAGDGAGRPLDGINSNNADQDAIHLEWQRVTEEPSDSEFQSLWKSPYKNRLYGVGIDPNPSTAPLIPHQLFMLFEMLVGPDGVALKSAHGLAQVRGFNIGAHGATSRCSGCHLGHSTSP